MNDTASESRALALTPWLRAVARRLHRDVPQLASVANVLSAVADDHFACRRLGDLAAEMVPHLVPILGEQCEAALWSAVAPHVDDHLDERDERRRAAP